MRRLRGFAARLLGVPFFRFCVIGGIGFLVDAAVLMALIHGAGAGPLAARVASFACAVLVTFELNRRWAFRDAAPRPLAVRLAGYLGVQGLGFACNYLVYANCYLLLRPAAAAPLGALVIASITALFVNYAGLRLTVFRPTIAKRN